MVYANDACCRIMGLPAEKFVRRKLAETEADSLTLKAMANRTEVVNVRKYVETLKRAVTCSVLLLPSPDNFACSVTLMNMVHQEAAEATSRPGSATWSPAWMPE